MSNLKKNIKHSLSSFLSRSGSLHTGEGGGRGRLLVVLGLFLSMPAFAEKVSLSTPHTSFVQSLSSSTMALPSAMLTSPTSRS